MKKVHYDKFGDGGIVCGVPFAENTTRDIDQVTCKRCQYSAPYTSADIGWGLLSKFLGWVFREGKHSFKNGICKSCGCSETAVAHFGWRCD